MLRRNCFRKGVFIGTILILVGAAVLPSISGIDLGLSGLPERRSGLEEGSLLVTLRASGYDIIDVNGGYSEIVMEDFGSLLSPGEPMLPSKTFYVGLPPGGEVVTVEVISAHCKEISDTYHIRPAPPYFGDEINEIKFSINDKIYSSTDLYPSVCYDFEGMSQMRKYSLAMIRFSPFQYYPSDEKLMLTQSITLRIHYQISTEVPSEVLADTIMEKIAAELMVNYRDIAPLYQSSLTHLTFQPYDYVIITTSSLYSTVVGFKTYKENLGYHVKIVNLSWITTNYPASDTQESIRDFLQATYISWGITHVLIVGRHSSIPMRVCYPDPNDHSNDDYHYIPTDYYYADLTGNWDSDGDGYHGERGQDNYDFTPEVYVGRIPVDNPTTVSNILAKIQNFGQAPNTGWKKNALLLGCVLNYANEDYSGYARTDGAELMEDCKNNLLVGYACTTMYEKDGRSPCSYACTYPLTNANVKSQWGSNTGWGIVNWNGHGSSTSVGRKVWTTDDGDGVPESAEINWPTMIQNSDSTVLNDIKPPVVFAASCNTAYPEVSNNLGASLLIQGASAYVGSTRVSWGTVGWSQPSQGGSSSMDYDFINNLVNLGQDCGHALYNAKVYYWTNFNWGTWGWRVNANMYDFNLYGDPSMVLAQVSSNNPPYKPDGPNPADGSTDISVDVDLSWTGGDPDPGNTVTYDIYLDTTDPPSKIVSNHTTANYDPGTLNHNTTYYWMIIAWDNHGLSNRSNVWTFTTEPFIPQPDLDSDGSLSWSNIVPGATVSNSFMIRNDGDPTSELDWEVTEWPTWGSWTFTPSSGDDLTPATGWVTVDVSVVAPDEQDRTFTGRVKIVNKNDPADYETISVSLSTPLNNDIITAQSHMIR